MGRIIILGKVPLLVISPNEVPLYVYEIQYTTSICQFFCYFSCSHYNHSRSIPLATSERVFYQKIGLEFREVIYL